METLVTDSPLHAATFVSDGHLVAFPTETVYGLGAPVSSIDAIKKLYLVKGRPSDNPLIVHIGRHEDFDQVGEITNEYTSALRDVFFPGPLTLVVKRKIDIPQEVTAGLNTVGIRMPDHDVGRTFLLACDTPMAAPSANLSGRPSPTSWSDVYDDLGGRIPCILNGGESRVGLESTVVDCTGETPIILRTGAISLVELQSVVPSARAAASDFSGRQKSPGNAHRHYAPNARVLLVNDTSSISLTEDSAFIGFASPAASDTFRQRSCNNSADYARSLYSFFRECERHQVKNIYCQIPPNDGIGIALLDRLSRAASATENLFSNPTPS